MVVYINKQGGTHSAEMCALLWKIMTWCHHYHITLKARHIPGCLNVMADLLSRSNQVQSTEWSLHPQVFKQICQKWFTPHVDLICHSSEPQTSTIPDPKAWDIDALDINWTGLTACACHHIAQSSDLHKLLSSFHRNRPKSDRNLPQWNLSVVHNELTKSSFEPMKDTDLKHLTLKTAFLLALASGKRRSKIHAWVANKVSNLGQWEKVALFPSSDFIAKNQLAREGSQSVSPVAIPALTTIVDRQFKEDRTLCPVQALRYYLD